MHNRNTKRVRSKEKSKNTASSSLSHRVEAVIAYGWESPAFYAKWLHDDDPVMLAELQGPVLNMGSPQSKRADGILTLFRKILLRDELYIERVKRHYARSTLSGLRRNHFRRNGRRSQVSPLVLVDAGQKKRGAFMTATQQKCSSPAMLYNPGRDFAPGPTVMTEEELIQFLRIPQISNAANHRHVIENLKRNHGLPRIHLCGKVVYLTDSVKAWLQKHVTCGQ